MIKLAFILPVGAAALILLLLTDVPSLGYKRLGNHRYYHQSPSLSKRQSITCGSYLPAKDADDSLPIRDAKDGEFPSYLFNPRMGCGGALLDKTTAITVGTNCTLDFGGTYSTLEANVSHFIYGSAEIEEYYMDSTWTGIFSICYHHQFQNYERYTRDRIYYNFAIVKLDRFVIANKTHLVEPICLADSSASESSDDLYYMVSFGTKNDSYNYAEKLQVVPVNFIPTKRRSRKLIEFKPIGDFPDGVACKGHVGSPIIGYRGLGGSSKVQMLYGLVTDATQLCTPNANIVALDIFYLKTDIDDVWTNCSKLPTAYPRLDSRRMRRVVSF